MMNRAHASAVLLSGAALLVAPSRARGQSMPAVRIATLPIEGAAEVFYGKDMGFFTKAGLEADTIQIMQNGASIAAAALAGSIDIGYSPVDVLATIHSKNVPIVAIAPANEYVAPSHNAGLIVSAASTVRQAKDLNGKTVAVAALHSLSESAPRVWMDRNGGDSSTVKFVEIPFPAMPAALDGGRVDAAFIAEPFLGAAAKNGRVLSYCFDQIANRFLISAWFATAQWAAAHGDAVNRFAAAMRETAAWTNKNAAQSGAILAKYTKLEPTVIATMPRSVYPEALTPGSMQPLIDVAAKYNGFPGFPAQELIYAAAKA